MKNHLLALALALAGITQANSQAPLHRTCSSADVLERQLAANPLMRSQLAEQEQQIEQYVTDRASQRGTQVVVTIPVVFHVVYNTTAQNISSAQIQSQLEVLNKDFRKLNTDASLVPSAFAGVAADAQIQFCLAQRDPNNLASTGIVRKQTTVTSFIDDNAVKFTAQGGSDAWPASKYLNIWVCPLGNNLLGYAQFPNAFGNAATDGVVVNYIALGTSGTATAPFNKGRTATHEVGHWLGLYHIWGDEPACAQDDQVTDTPQQKDMNYGCPTYPQTTQAGGRCSTANPSSMFMNYMDYTDDACMYMFTTGQASRMAAVLSSSGARSTLATSNGCVAPTATCTTPTGLSTTNLAATSATLNWTSTGAASYSVKYKKSTATTWTTVTSTTNSKSITGLSASTPYQYQIQGVCGTITSSLSTTGTFTTPAVTSTVTVGTGTAVTAKAPYGTYFMDQRVQYIITKAELTASGWTTGSYLKSLAFYTGAVSTQAMTGFTIKVLNTATAAFPATNFLSTTGATTVYTGNYTAVASSWNTHNFTTPFVYNGTGNILIDICYNNTTATTSSSVRYTPTTTYKALYNLQDLAAAGICALTTGSPSYNRPNMKLIFSAAPSERMMADEEVTIGEDTPLLAVYPNPATSEMNVQFTLEENREQVQLQIFNSLGVMVKQVSLGNKSQGQHTYQLNLNEGELTSLPAGMYICTLLNGIETQSVRFVLNR